MSDKDQTPPITPQVREQLRKLTEAGEIENTDSLEDALREATDKGLMSGMAGGTNI